MTCSNIILAKPEAGASVPYDLPTGESARLSFDASEISGLSMNANGGLVIQFLEGGELTLTNFQSMVDGGNLLYLSDGTLVDPAVLQASLASDIAPAAGSDAIVVGIPSANETKEYTVEAGKDYVLDFDIDTPVSAGKQNGDFVMTFENGGLVVLRGYETAMASADAPSITSSSKVCVYENEELITNIQALAETPVVPQEKAEVEDEEKAAPKKVAKVQADTTDEDVANIEPAAGDQAQQVANIEPAAGEPAASNSGYGFNSTPGTDPLGSLDDVGPIDPTLLNYGVDFQQYEQRLPLGTPVPINGVPSLTTPPAATLDETNLSAGNLVANGKVVVDFGNDGFGGIGPNGTFGAGGSMTGNTLASGGVPVSVTQTANGYAGHANGVLVFTFTIDTNTGDYVYTQVKPFDHADGANPNDVIRLEFGIVAKDADGDEANTTIRVDVLDDAPVVGSTGNQVDETDLAANPAGITVTGSVPHNYGADLPNNGFAGTGTFASSGSQLGGKLTTAGGTPVTVTFDAATGTYTGKAGNDTVFTLKVNADATYSFTLFKPLDHADPNNPNDIINLDFGVKATDFDGDAGTNIIRIEVKDDVPVIGNSSGDVDESNFDAGPLVYTDTVPHSFGADLGSIAANGTTSSSTPLTSNGAAVTITQTGNTYTGKTASGTTVFTLVLDPATGKYTYTQLENLDHPDTSNPDDIVSINFGVTIKSVDGTTAAGTITINVADDGPVAHNDYSAAEEGQTITGDVSANDDLSTDGPNTITTVTFNGTNHTVPAGGSVTVVGQFGTLIMNSNGTYSYTAKTNVPDNVNNVDKFGYTVRDADGDTDTADLEITVTDDGTPTEYPGTPSIGDDERAVDETALKDGNIEFNGSVATDYGLDGQGTAGGVSANGQFASGGSRENGVLSSNGSPVTVTQTGNTYTGKTASGATIFTLVINANGTYKFTLLDTLDHDNATDPNDIINLNFGVQISDADGDKANGNILIRVYDDAPVAIDDAPVTVRGAATVTGNVTTNDIVSQDGPNKVVDVTFGGTKTTLPTDGSNVTINGQFGKLTINNTGAYSYKPNSATSTGVDDFRYTLQDSDGDRDTANFSFNVIANYTPVIVQVGGPEILDETNLSGGTITETGTLNVNYFGENPATSNVTGTGSFSFNGSALNNALTHNGVAVNVTYNAATGTYTGAAGSKTIFTLNIAKDGSYTFKLIDNLDHANASDPNDSINLVFGVSATDKDGDKGTGTMVIRVHDDAPLAVDQKGLVQERLLNTGTQSLTGTVVASYGQDGPATSGALIGNNQFSATGEVDKGVLSHKGTAIVVTYNASTGTYVGMAGTLKVFDLVLNNNGTYKFNLYDTLDHGDRTRPDELITLNFGVKLKDYDGDTKDGFIRVDVEDDGPRIIQTANGVTLRSATFATTPLAANGVPTVDETDLKLETQEVGGKVIVDFGNDGPAAVDPFIANGNFQATGSVAGGALTSQGQAITITHTNGVYTGKAGSRTVFTFSIDDEGNYTFKLVGPLDHADKTNPNDIITLGFGVRATDEDGDYVDTFVRVDVKDDGPKANNDYTAAEEGQVITGNVAANDEYGSDGPGAVAVTKVVFNTTTYTVPAGGAATIVGQYGTLVIRSNGTYTYTAKTSVPDNVNNVDKFTYTTIDRDGDESTADLRVTVTDDGTPTEYPGTPGIGDDTFAVDETALKDGNIVHNGSVATDYGLDGQGVAGGVTANGQFSSGGSRVGNVLSSNGSLVTVTQTNGTYTGKSADGRTIFTMKVNADGKYVFTLLDTLDHDNATDPNDIISLNFGVQIKDADGDTDDGNILVRVYDDAPVALDDAVVNVNTGSSAKGNVTANDIMSQDGVNKVVDVTFNGVKTTLPTNGTNATIVGTFGTLLINNKGEYTYTPKNGTNGGVDQFSYTLQDSDGDKDTAKFSFNAKQDFEPVIVNASAQVDETNLSAGTVTQTGKVSVDYGQDGPGTVAGNGSFSSNGSQLGGKLTSNGVAVVVTYANGVYTAKAGSVTVFTLTIAANGDYTFRQFKAIDHADASNANDAINLVFGVDATDKDGDVGKGTITVRVLDDAPVAKNDNAGTTSGTNPVKTGNVLTNDTKSQDGATTVTQVKFGTTTVNVPTTGTITINGTYGKLVIGANGAYTYTANNNANGTDVFTYTIKDYDGDTSSATLTVVAKDGQPDITSITVDGSNLVDETNLANGTIVKAGKVNVDYGSDGAGTIAGNGTFTSSGSQLGGKLTSNGVAVVVTYANGVYTAKAGSTTVFTLTIAANGDYTFRQFKAIDHADASNANDVINLNFGVIVTDKDGDSDKGTVTIRVADDAPVAKNDNGGTTSGTNPKLTGNVMTNDTKSQDGATTVTKVTFGGKDYTVPASGNLTLVGTYGTLLINAAGVWTYTAKNLANGTDVFNYTIKDFDGDTSSANLTVVAKDGVPVAKNDTNTVDEGKSVTGNVTTNDTDGSDGPATVTKVTFDGKSYTVPTSGNLTITGTYGKLVINKSGAYTYTANKDAGGKDVFTYTLTDKDGDSDTATLTVTTKDTTAPIVVKGDHTVDETNLSKGTITQTGKLSIDYQGDGAGKVEGTGGFSSSGSQLGGKLTSNGTAIVVTYANGVYTAKAGSTTVFTLTVGSTGSYTFKQFEAIDHADASNANDVINLNFGVKVSDADGDSTTSTVTIRVRDDAPIAKDDNGGTTSGTKPTLTGNVLTNDTLSQDGATIVTHVKIGSKTYTVSSSGTTTINGEYGTLKISKSGAWTYTADNKANGVDKFTYTIKDGDGDSDTAVLTVTAKDGVPVAKDDTNTVGTNQTRVTGNILTNDSAGSDGGLKLLTVGTYKGTYGTLVVKADGSYTYTRTSTLGGKDTFNYTIQDADGDKDTAKLTITVAQAWTPPRGDGGDGGDGTPLVLDLNGDGINLTDKENGVLFDIDLDGVKDKTAWVKADDALLAIDHNGDGIINDRSELFGDTHGFSDGFDKLGSYDSNGDGIIDANDEVWDSLIVWQDLNQDGVSDANEMLTLAQVGIVGFRLVTTMPDGLYIEGNWISHIGSYIMADGTERQIVDAWFKYDKGYNVVEVDGDHSAVYGDDGADAFLFTAIGDAATTVHAFNAAEGDRLDLSGILQEQDAVTDAINDFVYVRSEGNDLIVSVDVTGSGNASNAVDIARLDGVADLNLEDLLHNGNIVV